MSKKCFDRNQKTFIVMLFILIPLMVLTCLLCLSSPDLLYSFIGIFGYIILNVTCVWQFVITPSDPSIMLNNIEKLLEDEVSLEKCLHDLTETSNATQQNEEVSTLSKHSNKAEIKKAIVDAVDLSPKECLRYAEIATKGKMPSKSIFFFRLESDKKAAQRENIEKAFTEHQNLMKNS